MRENDFGIISVELNQYSEMYLLLKDITPYSYEELSFFILSLIYAFSWLTCNKYFCNLIFDKESAIHKNINGTTLGIFIFINIFLIAFLPMLLWYVLMTFFVFLIIKALQHANQ